MRAPTIAIAWMCATVAAVGVSWLGVRTVVHDAALTPVQLAVPVSPVATGSPPPMGRLTAVLPSDTTSVRPTTTAPPASAPPTSTVKMITTTTTPTTTTASADVQRYTVKGGEVVLSMTSTSAALVSATPVNGYSVQAWQETGWLRVDFTSGNAVSSVFATWNGHPPSVQTYEQ